MMLAMDRVKMMEGLHLEKDQWMVIDRLLSLHAKSGALWEDVTTEVMLTYTYSGTMADGSSYPAFGSAQYSFEIRPAPVVITVLDSVYVAGEGQTLPDLYEFETTGLLNGDQLTKQPTFAFTDTNGKEIDKNSINLNKEGSYYVLPADADAGINYEITYQGGRLSITAERKGYTVRFELQGHAGEVSPITGVKAGSLIDAPENPRADGFIFKGWYKDSACSKAWNFDTDTVQENTVLYACWLTAAPSDTQGVSLCIQEIRTQVYTGNALKPAVAVYAKDGETQLKAGKDYTIKYCNNVEADIAGEEIMGGVSPTGQEGDCQFTKKLAYVVITGKGNYAGTVYKNFHIGAAPICLEDGK